MSDIRITPAVQKVTLLGLLAVIVAALVAQRPELQRYMNIKSM